YDQFRRDVLPYPTGNLHPGFFGWVMGNGSLTGAMADALASTMNAHVAGYDQSAAFVERQVISWLSELIGYPKDASGLLVTGGTMANLNGLAVARNEKAGFDVRAHGVAGEGFPRLRVYGSKETHSWIYKACELMGLGHDAFRAIPVNSEYQIDVEACRTQIEQDVANGDRPFCIVGTAGTVNTAAVDDFSALRALADEFDLWFHIDGAFGTLAAWSPDTAALVAGQELSDSIAFDLHKWGYMPYDVGCVLTRHSSAQERAFGSEASYLSPTKRGLAVGTTYFADKGVQLSRSFRALKVWMCMKEQGVDKIGRMIARNVKQAQTLKELVDARPKLERLAPVPMNIVCFRYKDDSLGEAQLDDLNQEILLRIQESGRSVPSHTLVEGKFAIRVCITNHRTHESDLIGLVDDVLAHAQDILQTEAA
ncbi:MAG: amino acid decarboxylase, partial [Erythrobacter sp.]|nr:amino acid decarboxylase [Erythrobacter sp.]